MKRAVRYGIAVLATAYALNFGYHAVRVFPDFHNYQKLQTQAEPYMLRRAMLERKIDKCKNEIQKEELTQRLDEEQAALAPIEAEMDKYTKSMKGELKKGIFPGMH